MGRPYRRMWQGKCFEEQGEIGSAIAIYKELMGHAEPKLRDLQRHVGYFYVVALSKHKRYAAWRPTGPRDGSRSPTGEAS